MRPLILALFLGMISLCHADTAPEAEPATASLPSPPRMTLQPFYARYETRYKLSFLSFDIEAERRLQPLDKQQWQISFDASASAASLHENARFRVVDGQIQPLEYSMRGSGLIQEDDRSLLFDHDQQQIRDMLEGSVFSNRWQQGIQDKLTYMLQASLDLAAGKELLSYPVFEKNKAKTYAFERLGNEQLNTRVGRLNTVKIRQIRKDRREITAWLAVDKNYLLVRLLDSEKGKTRYEINLVETDL